MEKVDYEKIADEAVPSEPIDPAQLADHTPKPATAPEDGLERAAKEAREYLPLTHPKYQGIAEQKGYAQGDDFSGNRLQAVRYSHEAMIDVILAEPTITQNELAKRFGRSVGWISVVMGSDAFQGALAKRRDDIVNPELIATVEERMRGLAQQSLQILSKKLEQSENSDLALEALKISSKALGMGARPQGGNTTNQFVIQLPSKAASTEDWIEGSAKRIANG